MRTLYGGRSSPPYNVRIGYSIHTLHEMAKINFQFLSLILVYNFQIKPALSVVICVILAFFDHPRTQGFGRNSKEWNCQMRYWPIVVPIDTESISLIERIAAENKYLREGRENKQIIPSLIDFMTGRFYIVILFTKPFHGSADFAFQTRSQSVCTE